MQAPDADKFKAGMIEEFQDHCNKNHWEFVPRSSLPPGTKVLPSVWSMRRKRHIATREVYKWKSRLTVHGGRSIKGIHYWETYSPMVRWATIRLTIILALIYGWHSCQMDFVLAYTQADPKTQLYMKMPQGFSYKGSADGYVLKLKKNLYGAKDARLENT